MTRTASPDRRAKLLKKIVEMFQTNKAPLNPAVTVEIMAFIEAALKSANNEGSPVRLESEVS